MHGLLGFAGLLGLIGLAFGKRAAASTAAVLLLCSAVFALAVMVALLDAGGPLDWIGWMLYGRFGNDY